MANLTKAKLLKYLEGARDDAKIMIYSEDRFTLVHEFDVTTEKEGARPDVVLIGGRYP